MLFKAETPTEAIKRATQAALKAISGRHHERVVTFTRGLETATLTGDTVILPEPADKPTYGDLQRLRGNADAVALRLHFHNEKMHRRLSPRGDDARKLFNVLEQVRVETLGERDYPGVRQNLGAIHDQAAEAYREITDRDSQHLYNALGVLARERMSHQPLPGPAKQLADLWRGWLNEHAPDALDRLAATIDDQNAFAEVARELFHNLDLSDLPPADQERDDESEQDGEQGAEDQTQDESGEGGEDEDGTSQMGPQAASDLSLGDDGGGDVGDEMDMMTGGESPAGPTDRNDTWPENEARTQPYKTYQTQFDEVLLAEDLCEAEELERLRAQLDKQLDRLQGVVGKLANRLQRQLMAKQTRSWEFDLEEGILDVGRLSRVVTDPMHPLSFKQELDADFRDTVVTLLIDNSGSMRGRPITIAATSADILARTLERCGVKVEILGFTTRAWKGGKSREMWVEKDKPENPGRLNDLRHIIYKQADAPWRRARKNLGLMLKEGILKENIDGEALMWAHNRLLGRTEQRRILMVVSDGAPVDDATLSTNPGNYLERHLRDVIGWIETKSDIELIAVGIGHDVTRYYSRAVTLLDAEDLGGTIMSELADLFDESPKQVMAPARSRQKTAKAS